MNKNKIKKLSIAVAMVEYYQKLIDNIKEELRNLTDDEIEEINKNKHVTISRQDYTKTTYSKEYKEAIAEVAKKFPPEKNTIKNHTINLKVSAYVKSKAKIIIEEFADKNKTQLRLASKMINKNK